MYLVKPNGNYHILITDIGVTISFPNSMLIEKSRFDTSSDAKKLVEAGIILVEEANENTTLNQDTLPTKTEDKIFVAREEETKINTDVFVRQSEDEKVAIIPETEVIVEETVAAPVEEVKVVETSVEEVKVVETPVDNSAAEKAVTSKSTNKRVKK